MLPDVTATLSQGAHQTLGMIENHESEISIPNLTARSESAKSTITRHVNTLEADGLVTARFDDRTKYVTITFSGELFLAVNGTRESEMVGDR
jgi:DNA-binding MarR family transcriptional regulator